MFYALLLDSLVSGTCGGHKAHPVGWVLLVVLLTTVSGDYCIPFHVLSLTLSLKLM